MNMVLATSAERVQNISLVVTVVVLVLLFIVLAISFYLYYRYYKKCIKHELEDEFLRGEIKKRYKKFFYKYDLLYEDDRLAKEEKVKRYVSHTLVKEVEEENKAKKGIRVLGNIGLFLVYAVFIGVLAFAIYVRAGGEQFTIGNSYYVVILSGSMETARESNTYLSEHHLTNQIPTFSLIGIDKVSSSDQIALYDIVSYYDEDHNLIVHRVIDIDNNEAGELVYTLRGDANAFSNLDERELTFDQIQGKYNGFQNFGLGLTLNYLRSNVGIIAVSLGLILIGVYDFFDSQLGRRIKERKMQLYPIIDDENIAALRGYALEEEEKKDPTVARDGTYIVHHTIYYNSIESELKTLFASNGLVFKTNGVRLLSGRINADDLYLHLRLLNKVRIEDENIQTNVVRVPPLADPKNVKTVVTKVERVEDLEKLKAKSQPQSKPQPRRVITRAPAKPVVAPRKVEPIRVTETPKPAEPKKPTGSKVLGLSKPKPTGTQGATKVMGVNKPKAPVNKVMGVNKPKAGETKPASRVIDVRKAKDGK